MTHIIQKLIADRKHRLGYIASGFIAQEMLDIIHNGEFLFTPLRKVDQRAVKDNQETDKQVLKMFDYLLF